jgi:hypothetical protein
MYGSFFARFLFVWTQISLFRELIRHEQSSLHHIPHAYQMRRSRVFIHLLLSFGRRERASLFVFNTSVSRTLDTVHLKLIMSGIYLSPHKAKSKVIPVTGLGGL